MKYVHTNIISQDWKRLASFYVQVFDCKLLLPLRDLSGEWLSKATAVKNAHIKGAHLRLPGYGKGGPTLEIFEYDTIEEQATTLSNRAGFGHLAFEVNNVQEVLDKALAFGGKAYGQIDHKEIEELGTLTFVYLKDPDGNIIEIQNWGKEVIVSAPKEATETKSPSKEDTKQEVILTKKDNNSQPTVRTQNEDSEVPKTKRELLNALQNDLDNAKQDVYASKEEIKQSREEADHQLNKTLQKFQHDPFATTNIPKTKQELLSELKEEMQLDEKKETIVTPTTPLGSTTTNKPKEKKEVEIPTPVPTVEEPVVPAKLTVITKTTEGKSTFDLATCALTMSNSDIAKNLRSFTTIIHADSHEKSLLEWIGHQYRADLVPLMKQYTKDSNLTDKKTWILLPRLRDSLHHLLGKCKEEPELLITLKLDRIGLKSNDFISTYENLLTITTAVEAAKIDHLCFAYDDDVAL